MCSNEMDDQLAFPEIEVFIVRFLKNYQLLVDRYNRFKELGDVFYGEKDKKKIIDRFTYFDMIIVQLRAICIENEQNKNNYTLQNLLKKTGNDELVKQIDEILEQPFVEGIDYATSNNSHKRPLTIRNAIKILADNCICHYDYMGENYSTITGISAYVEIELSNPHARINFDFLMRILSKCVNEGLKKYLEQHN